MTKSDQPVESFGPELLATLRKGADQEIRITFSDERLVTRFIQRLNQLRLAMKKANHPDWQQLYRCGFHPDLRDRKTLIIAPKDSEFRSFLQTAGVDVAAPPEITEVRIETPLPGAPIDPAESFLATLTEATTIPPAEPTQEPLANTPGEAPNTR